MNLLVRATPSASLRLPVSLAMTASLSLLAITARLSHRHGDRDAATVSRPANLKPQGKPRITVCFSTARRDSVQSRCQGHTVVVTVVVTAGCGGQGGRTVTVWSESAGGESLPGSTQWLSNLNRVSLAR